MTKKGNYPLFYSIQFRLFVYYFYWQQTFGTYVYNGEKKKGGINLFKESVHCSFISIKENL